MKKNINVFLKLVSSFLILTVIFSSSPYLYAKKPKYDRTFFPKKVTILGGSFAAVRSQPYDHKKFEVHHLISCAALNVFAQYIFLSQELTLQNLFLDDKKQSWAPSILLSHEDHLMTLSNPGYTNSFFNLYTFHQALEIINYGRFLDMLDYEIKYIDKNLNTDGRYDLGIQQARAYIKSLEIKICGNKCSFKPFGYIFSFKLPSTPIFENPEPSLNYSDSMENKFTQTDDAS